MSRHCPRCLRARCLCALALQPPLQHDTELVILQHPLEQFEVKGTARLLALSLNRCRLEVGEVFAPLPNPEQRIEALLYPGGESLLAPDVPAQRLRLYALDGSWRKSRLLLHRNPWLQALPRVHLETLPSSAYTVRKAHAGHQLSTLEACGLALDQLEAAPVFKPALDGVLAGLVQALSRRAPDSNLHGPDSG
ncbi:DTW domain-containing protein YfiP [Inhella inkyongensis]|uniref:tRNA-uridine aminocarboxypropyltransferase n=1 Tax=Inhella inkyongensis TaxID=392593 RepID=A0A840S1R6_9BURK|nr:tRNA-uridine aminocarboxypropyltransferase [Inhella inkyongensis]MBB5204235.1 DTW domain-containing protein YfiP [Inhella inkyongensis]